MGFGSSSGGGGSISSAGDTALNNPATNEVLSYDASLQKWKNATVSRPATAFIVTWSGSAWQYKGATVTARPAGMITGDIIQFIGNPGGSLPGWAAVNDLWTQG